MHPWITMDPYIVLSLCNMKLRNFYPNLEAMCDDLNIDKVVLEDKLKDIGYVYEPAGNHFVSLEAKN
ncbi:MAG: DUF4250 domain-containing protein [Bacilli bacterium]|nr:DUF4250 domain-containing protein [Bacilli bacterium]